MQPPNYLVTLSAAVLYWLNRGDTLAAAVAHAAAINPGLTPRQYYLAGQMAQTAYSTAAALPNLRPSQPLSAASTRRPRPTGRVMVRFLVRLMDQAGNIHIRTPDVPLDWSDSQQHALEEGRLAAEDMTTQMGGHYPWTVVSVDFMPFIY